MYAIIGLGNPDKKYDKTRHNVGFDVIDELARQMAVEVKTKRHKALCGIVRRDQMPCDETPDIYESKWRIC